MEGSTQIIRDLFEQVEAFRSADELEQMLLRIGGVQRLATASDETFEAAGFYRREREIVRAAVKLGVHVLSAGASAPLSTAGDVIRTVMSLATLDHEEVWLISVDPGLRVRSLQRLAQGGRASCAIDPTDVLRSVLASGGSGFFMVHNHPSSDPTPSDADLRFTRRLGEMCTIMQLPMHDHLVIAGAHWASCVSGAAGMIEPVDYTGGGSEVSVLEVR